MFKSSTYIETAFSCILFFLSSCRGPSISNFIQSGKSYELVVQDQNLMTSNLESDLRYILTLSDVDFNQYSGHSNNMYFEVNGDFVNIYKGDTMKKMDSDRFYLHRTILNREIGLAHKASRWWAVYKRQEVNDTLCYYLRKIYNPSSHGSYYSFFQKDSTEFLIKNYHKDSKYHYESNKVIQFKLVKEQSYATFDENYLNSLVKKDNNLKDCDSVRPIKKLNINEVQNYGKKTVVVYSYIACPPCALLLNDLVKHSSEGAINPDQIKLVNTLDDSLSIAHYLKKRNHPFTYIRHDIKCYGAAPSYAGYDEQGVLQWYKKGYSKESSREISAFLKE